MLQSRTSGEPLPAEAADALARLEGAGPPNDALAHFLAAIAGRDEPPPVPPGLPEQVADLLEQLREAVSGDTGALMDLVEAAFGARAGTALTEAHRGTLDRMREQGSPHAEVAGFLAAVAAGERPAVPAGLDEDASRFLAQLDERLERMEKGVFELDELVRGALEARLSGGELALELKAFLESLRASGEPHRGFADFLLAIADRSALPPPVPDGVPDDVSRILTEVRAAVVDQALLTEVVEAAIAARGRSPLSDEHRTYLEGLRGQGPPHEHVAAFLDVVAEGGDPVVPDDLDPEAQRFLEGIVARLSAAES